MADEVDRVAAWLHKRIMDERRAFGKPGEYAPRAFAELDPSTQYAWRDEAREIIAIARGDST